MAATTTPSKEYNVGWTIDRFARLQFRWRATSSIGCKYAANSVNWGLYEPFQLSRTKGQSADRESSSLQSIYKIHKKVICIRLSSIDSEPFIRKCFTFNSDHLKHKPRFLIIIITGPAIGTIGAPEKSRCQNCWRNQWGGFCKGTLSE